MSRGRDSLRAFDAAVAVARVRGQVVFVRTWPGSACDFLLITPYGIVSVCVRRTRRIQAGVEEIVQDHRETLNRIRGSEHCAGVSSEFWLWCPYGTMRFFQLEGFSLVEISMFGLPCVPPVTGEISGRPAKSSGESGAPEKKPDEESGKKSAQEKIPGTDEQNNPAPASANPTGPREPPYIRYLRKRNAGLRQLEGNSRGIPPPTDKTSSREGCPSGAISGPDHPSP